MKAWQILLVLLFPAACSRPAAQQPSEPQPASSDRKPVVMNSTSVEPQKPESPPISKSPAVDFSEDSDALATRRTRKKTKRVTAAHAGAQKLHQVNLRALYQRALQGDVNAQVDLGLIYFEGKRVPKNPAQTQHWWTFAAQRGHPVARANLRLLQPQPTSDYNKPRPPKPAIKIPKEQIRPAVTFFGTPGKGQRFVFIIDKSWSMLAGRLPIAKMELLKTLKQLPTGSQFMIYFFNHHAEPMPSGLLPANPQSIALAENWIRTRGAFGDTNPRLALKLAFEIQPETVWLLSDGWFPNYQAIFNQLQHDNANGAVRVNTVAFCDRTCEQALLAIARAHGGTYRFVAQ